LRVVLLAVEVDEFDSLLGCSSSQADRYILPELARIENFHFHDLMVQAGIDLYKGPMSLRAQVVAHDPALCAPRGSGNSRAVHPASHRGGKGLARTTQAVGPALRRALLSLAPLLGHPLQQVRPSSLTHNSTRVGTGSVAQRVKLGFFRRLIGRFQEASVLHK
jgi:hypothetical protein